MKDPADTFRWIVSILRKRNIPFVVAGGLAARSYGCDRPLNDIDIDIHAADFPKILDDIQQHLVFGPGRYLSDKWDLPLATLNHKGQDIDISGGDDTKIYDEKNKKWVLCLTDFTRTTPREIFGLTVPVLPPDELIAYKQLLSYSSKKLFNIEHQLLDIAAAEIFLKSQAGATRVT
jgi:hypothetical protein